VFFELVGGRDVGEDMRNKSKERFQWILKGIFDKFDGLKRVAEVGFFTVHFEVVKGY
jgi:hypothetical protein